MAHLVVTPLLMRWAQKPVPPPAILKTWRRSQPHLAGADRKAAFALPLPHGLTVASA